MPASGCRQPDPDVPGKLDGAEPLRSPKARLCADRKKGGRRTGPPCSKILPIEHAHKFPATLSVK